MSPDTPNPKSITPMLPLHAIPTEVIRKGFRPYRGFATSISINLSQEDEPLRWRIGEPIGPLGAEKVAELALDVMPVFEVIAKLFGYDLQLLKAGNGDCGVEGHDWNRYGTQDRVPQVVRWRADGGEALLCIGTAPPSHAAQVVGLADKAMMPKLGQVFEAIGELRQPKSPTSIDRPAGNLLEKVMLDENYSHELLYSSLWCELLDDQPNDQQLDDMRKLRFSCRTGFGTPRGSRVRLPHHILEELRRTRVPGRRVALIGPKGETALVLQPGEPTPAFLIDQIYAASVLDAERAMHRMMSDTFETQVERVHYFLHDEELAVTVGDAAENERAFALAHFVSQGESGHFAVHFAPNVLKTTFSREFRSTPPKNLLGTQSVKKLYAGHVMRDRDLIELMIVKVHIEADRVLDGFKEPFELRGKVIASDDLELQRDKGPAAGKAHQLEKPYTALYRGLPIRVTDSFVIQHPDLAEGLACDYYVDHQNQALHFVSLYRVKGGG